MGGEEIDALETRIGTALAARYLGTTRRHIEKLIATGALTAWDVRLPGAKRARWAVTVSSVRLLLEQRVRNTRTEAPAPRVSAASRSARCDT